MTHLTGLSARISSTHGQASVRLVRIDRRQLLVTLGVHRGGGVAVDLDGDLGASAALAASDRPGTAR